MNIVDSIIILFLLAGAVLGFKKGAIKSLVALVGLIVLVVASYYLKDIVADLIFPHVPFLKFSGGYEGLVTLNILLYESISYVIVFVILSFVLSLILKITGIIDKIINATIILGLPSKIIGIFLGVLESIVLVFIICFLLLQNSNTTEFIRESSIASSIVDKTPIISLMTNKTNQAIKDISTLKDKYKNNDDKDACNREILNTMLHYEVITPEMTQTLIDSKKLDFNGAQTILDTYKENK